MTVHKSQGSEFDRVALVIPKGRVAHPDPRAHLHRGEPRHGRRVEIYGLRGRAAARPSKSAWNAPPASATPCARPLPLAALDLGHRSGAAALVLGAGRGPLPNSAAAPVRRDNDSSGRRHGAASPRAAGPSPPGPQKRGGQPPLRSFCPPRTFGSAMHPMCSPPSRAEAAARFRGPPRLR